MDPHTFYTEQNIPNHDSRYPPPTSLPNRVDAPAQPTNSVPRRSSPGRRKSEPPHRSGPAPLDLSARYNAPEHPANLANPYYSTNDYTYAQPTNPPAGSFAQRAAVLTGRSLPPDPNTAIANSGTSAKKDRRSSLNRPIGGLYSEIQQHRRDSWPAGKSPTSPRRTSFPAPPSTTGAKPTASSNGQDTSQFTGSQTNSPANITASKPRRATTMDSETTNDKWASDRSPLQKLEVKLSDISKEEKRARVAQAEQKLRASKQNRRPNATQIPETSPSDPPPREIRQGSSSRPAGPRDLPQSKTESVKNGARTISASRSGRSKDPDFAIPNRESSKDRGLNTRDSARPSHSPATSDPSEHDTGLRSSQLPRDHHQALPRARHVAPKLGSGSRDVPQQQMNLYGARSQPTHDRTTAAEHGGQEDFLPPQAVASSSKGHAYRVPPQAAAGVLAREKVGFDEREHGLNGVSENREHHLPRIFHRGLAQPAHAEAIGAKPLEEWKSAGVARLGNRDFVDEADDDSTWWEQQGSKGRRRSQRGPVEDPYPEGNGESDETKISDPETFTTVQRVLHARPYKTASVRGSRRTQFRSMLKGDLSLRSSHPLAPSVGLASDYYYAYSYSCPSLAIHDLLHPEHICKANLDKELTMSMRSIRIRTVPTSTSFDPPLYLKCGPLLRYTGLKRQQLENNLSSHTDSLDREVWRGSIMIVTTDAESQYDPAPVLRLFPEPMEKIPPPEQLRANEKDDDELPHHYLDPIAGMPKLSRTGKTVYVKPVDDLEHEKDLSKYESNDDGLYEDFRSAAVPTAYGTPDYRHGQNGSVPRQARRKAKPRPGQKIKGHRLHAERGVTFWRFNLEVELQTEETRIAYSINNGPGLGFWVPARGQTMNIMFHSCNGFSLSINPDDFCGPDPLWRDVLNEHQTQPFHVMIGGGDQIYNDAVMKQSPLFGEWLDIKNPHHKHEAKLTPELLEELETFYLERYSMWFSQGLFGMANAQIPMVNMWDDHDIIDGFGSYPHHFMSTPVFCGLGAVAFKYYMLFQHQSVPAETSADEPSWLLGASPGPYINELSRSVFLSLGKHVAFLGLDCRTERMREEILSEASYDLIFDRCRREIVKGDTKHLIVLLGVPIAYPRLVWLENVLTSRALDPIKAMGRMGMLGNFLNKFDGGVEILDDLDDHWTAKNHKEERNWFIQELQELAADLSVRITILGGDVHLAAVGQFVTKPKLQVPKDQDHRYMPNIISSAIVNAPPPEMMSDILNKRNKTHHLDQDTDEYMIPVFSHDVDGRTRNNKRLLPRRNWLSIREYQLGTTPPASPTASEPGTPLEEEAPTQNRPTPLQRTLSLTRGDIKPRQLLRRLSGRGPRSYLDDHETFSPPTSPSNGGQALSKPRDNRLPPAAPLASVDSASSNTEVQRPHFFRRPTDLGEKLHSNRDGEDSEHHINLEHGLDVCLHCEIDQRNPAGRTTPYRLLVPSLYYDGESDENTLPFKRPNLLQRLSSMKGPRYDSRSSSELHSSHGSASGSDMDNESVESEDHRKPRRWSFGLEKRRRYRDQTPPPSSDFERSGSQRNPSMEAHRLGLLSGRPSGGPASSAQPSEPVRGQSTQQSSSMQPPRQANKFQSVDGQLSEERFSVDSLDYHANINTGGSRQEGGPPIRQRSKAEKMLGAVGIDRTLSGTTQTRRASSLPFRTYSERRGQSGDANRLSGYGGIDAYSPDDKRSWRRSLRLFS